MASKNATFQTTTESTRSAEILENDSSNLLMCSDPLTAISQATLLVITPVTITLVMVAITVHILCVENTCFHLPIELMFPGLGEIDTQDSKVNAANAAKDVSFVIVYIMCSTFVLLSLLYFRCYPCLLVMAMMIIVLLCSTVTLNFWRNIFNVLDVPIDFLTMGLLIWNLILIGLVAFFLVGGPLLLQQTYLIYISILISNFITTMLNPTVSWALLVCLIIWDLIAVLTPCGPLNLMLKLIRKRKENQEPVYLPPVLIYSTMAYCLDTETSSTQQSIFDSDDKIQSPVFRPSLGLGDFVFYGLLIGLTRQLYTLLTVLAAGISILTGLIGTLACLAYFHRPLPALPISLTIGLITCVIFHFSAESFSKILNTNMILI